MFRVLLIFGLVASCKTPDGSQVKSSGDAGSFKTVSASEWTAISQGKNTEEIGCVCEGEQDKWQLFRYAKASTDFYKVWLTPNVAFDACLKAKTVDNNCQFKL